MSKDLTTQTTPQITHFKVREGSNYKVIMSYGREEIISFDHYQKLAKVIYNKDNIFVTVNDIIVQVKDIRIIEPTKEKTAEEKAKIEKDQTEAKQREYRKTELLTLKVEFQQKYWDKVYGQGRWRKFRPFGGKFDPNVKLLDSQDLKNCQEAFEQTYPELINEINENCQPESKTE